MQIKPRSLEQQIAVFGESGSGKTVLLSSFYGAAQEPRFLQSSLYNLIAEDVGQGNQLHRNYLGMRNSATPPITNHFVSTTYSFLLKLKSAEINQKKSQFDALRLVWHDYPGEWFEQDAKSPLEAQRRVDTFRSLLKSDVAMLLVDAHKLKEFEGEEERYFKLLFSNIRNGVLGIKDDLLDDGNRLVEFPRIWVIALSKADLLPEYDVYRFRDLIVEKASEEIEQLRLALGQLIDGSEALSVGEDFLLLSSAKFEPGVIDLQSRVGIEQILPIASLIPLERHAKWAERKALPAKVVENLMQGVIQLAAGILDKKIPGGGPVIKFILNHLGDDLVSEAVKFVEKKIIAQNEMALSKHTALSATLTKFKLDLQNGEEAKVFLRSSR